MPGDFQFICVSLVGENRGSPASTETPGHFVLHVLRGIILVKNLTGLSVENKGMFAVTKNEQ